MHGTTIKKKLFPHSLMSHIWVQNFITSMLIQASYICYKYHYIAADSSLPPPIPFPAGCHYDQHNNKTHDDTAFLWNFHCNSKLATLSDLRALTENLFSHNLTTKKNKNVAYKIICHINCCSCNVSKTVS